MTKFMRAVVATIITASIGSTANVASAGPPLDPKPNLWLRSSQEVNVYDSGDDGFNGVMYVNVFYDSNGVGEFAYFFLSEMTPKPRYAQCTFNPDDLSVREDAGLAMVNTTADVANCFVSETCDEDGTACTPDYEDNITVAATLRRPGAVRSTSSSTQTRSAGTMSTSTCQTKEGSDFAEVSVSVNGHGWTSPFHSAAKRECKEVGKTR